MEPPRMFGIADTKNSLLDSMQFTTNYSFLDRDEESFIRRHNIQTTQSTLVGIENPDMSCMPLDDISLFQSRIMNSSTSRLPPEGAERMNRTGANKDCDMSNLSDSSSYKELLQLVNEYDLEDVSDSEVPDKILPPVGGQSYRDRFKNLEGKDLSVPSTEQILALTKEHVGLTPTELYDRIMESLNSKPATAYKKLSESDMDMTNCGQPQLTKSSRRNVDQTFKIPPSPQQSVGPDSFFDFSKPNDTLGDSSFVPMSKSILDRDEKSVLEKHGGLAKQADITCPADQPTLPWNVSNVTLFDLDTTGSRVSRRREDSSRESVRARTKMVHNESSELDDLTERIYALSPSSTSLSAIAKIVRERDTSRASRDSSARQKNTLSRR